MSLVIRVQDQFGSFFCGFKEDESGISSILLSKSKENAIQFPDDTDEVCDTLIKIIQLTKGDLLAGAQEYSAAPNIASEQSQIKDNIK